MDDHTFENGCIKNLIDLPVPFPRSYWIVPGLLMGGEYPGARSPEKAREKMSGLLNAGVRRIVNLMEEDEIDHAGSPFASYEAILEDLSRERSIQTAVIRFPVVDMRIPEPDIMTEILNTIDGAVEQGKAVYVHCWGGIGRTGTVAGCFLIRHGLAHGGNVLEKIACMRLDDPESYRISPEGPEQKTFIQNWHTQETGSPTLLNRYAGSLMGGAVGDALGAPVEFMSTDEILSHYGDAGIADYDRAYGRIGAITDDTQMTLFTAEGLLRGRAGGRLDDKDALHGIVRGAYLDWLRTQQGSGESRRTLRERRFLMRFPELFNRRAPGNSCLSALQNDRKGTIAIPINNSKGCGGVMRMAPVGLMIKNPEDAFQTGCELAALTHGHPSGYLAAGVLASMISEIRTGSDLPDAVQAGIAILKQYPKHEECLSAIYKAVTLAQKTIPAPEIIERMGGGWVAEEALAISVYCALTAGDNFSAGVLAAVNHSGDSDSTGAITGNILGCHLGGTAIPPKWVDRLELNELIQTIAVDLFIEFRDDTAWRARYQA